MSPEAWIESLDRWIGGCWMLERGSVAHYSREYILQERIGERQVEMEREKR